MPLDQSFSRLVTASSGNLTATNAAYYYGIGIAIDVGAGLIWFYTFDNGWNGDTNLSNQNPATGVGGYALTGITGAIFVGIGGFTNAGTPGAATVNFGGSSFKLAQPSGFSAWDAAATLDPSNKGPNITLSSGNLHMASGSTGWECVKSTTSKSTGKFYFEVSLDSFNATMGLMVGVCNAAQSTSNFPASGTGIGYLVNGAVYRNGTNIVTITSSAQIGSSAGPVSFQRYLRGTVSRSSGAYYFEATINSNAGLDARVGIADASVTPLQGVGTTTHAVGWLYNGQVAINNSVVAGAESFTTGNTIAVAYNINTQKVWFYKTKWNNDILANQNPATGTGGISTSGISGSVYPGMDATVWAGNSSMTLNFGATSFAYPIPSGFSAWEAVTASTGNADGVASVNGVALLSSVGHADGVASALAISINSSGVGNADGVATADAVGVVNRGTGHADGTASVSGTSTTLTTTRGGAALMMA